MTGNRVDGVGDPVAYVCRRAPYRPALNGRLDDLAWATAQRSPRFVDMVDGSPGLYDTRAAMLWDDAALYVGFWIEEPYPSALLAERDAILFTENDVELFIEGEDCYYELEVNALGTRYEVLFGWRDAAGPGSRFDIPELDPRTTRALTFGGDDDRSGLTFWRGGHPRGLRWAWPDWDLPGLEMAVNVDGALNDPRVVSRGWIVELAVPWSGLRLVAGSRPLPPRSGDVWRMFLGRFQKLVLGGREVQPHPAWVWTPHGRYDTHRPECWTPVRFSDAALDLAAPR